MQKQIKNINKLEEIKKVFKEYAIELYGTSLIEKVSNDEEPSLKHIFD
jgi:hypothetical protein